MSASVSCAAVQELATTSVADLGGEALEQSAGVIGLGVEREPHPEPELRVVLEERVVPGRPAPGGVDRPWCRRQVGAVDRRAAGRVGHDHPVAEELADQPDVGRLAAAAARARELEERLEDLAALDRIVRQRLAIERAGSTGRSPIASRSTSRCSATGSMLMALWLESVLLLAGQTSTHTPQPVQSSGATWIVSRWSGSSRDRNSLWRKSAGADSTEAVGKTFIRMVACGQTIAHLPQSMQMAGSQIGIIWAIARFSYFAVPVGNVPSTGSALTGNGRRRRPSIAT